MRNTFRYTLIISFLPLSMLFACKKEVYRGVSKLKLKKVIDFSDWEMQPLSIKNAHNDQYLAHTSGYSQFNNNIVLLDYAFNEQQSYENSYQIKDYISLPDGRVLISQFYYGDLENLVLLSENFDQSEQFSLDLEYPPLLHLTENGIIMVSGNHNFGTSKIAKFNFNFEEVWSTELALIRPYFSTYHSSSDRLYVVNNSFTLFELNGNNGEVTNSFGLSTQAWNLTRSGNYIYAFGLENDGTYCGDDLEVIKLSLDGTEVWSVQLGRKKANDHVSDILVDNGFIYISGSYGESNCLEGVTSNHSDFYTAVISENGEIVGHRVENINKDNLGGSGRSIVKSKNGAVYLLGTIDAKSFEDRKVLLYEYKTD